MTLKRIAYVVNVFPKFSETFIANEIAELKRRGIEVAILSRRFPVESLRHKVVTENDLEALTYYDEDSFLPYLRKFRPQIIHAHFATQPTDLARKLSATLCIPYSLTAHGYDVYRRPPTDFADRCRGANAVVTVSEANAHYMVNTLGAPASNLSVIPCGIDTNWFKPQFPGRSQIPLLVCVARMRPVKNLPVLLQACATLRDQGVKFRCVVLGDGDDRPMLEALRNTLGLNTVVQFPGITSQENVRNWWRQASIGLLTSLSEGMPVSLMEALSCAVPVIAPAIGGIPEMIKHSVNGFVVPVNNPKAVASAITKILTDTEMARQMRFAARETALDRFSVGLQVDNLLDVWNQILHSRYAA